MSLIKIHVSRDPWAVADRMAWVTWCAYCETRYERHTWRGAMVEAEQHAAEPCDGIRLALLLERLKRRLEGYERARRVNLERGDVHTAAAYQMVVEGLSHNIRMATE